MRAAKGLAVVIFMLLALLICTDYILRFSFPHFMRLSSNYSATYLQREIIAAAHDRSSYIFLGDSAIWGYKLPAVSAAPSVLRIDGCDCRNLSFEGGSPANTYSMLRLLFAAGAEPRAIIFNVNQKELNPADSAYRTLHPSVEALVEPLLDERERSSLTTHSLSDWNATIDAAISRSWVLYGMRSDLREALFDDVDAVHVVRTAIARRTGLFARQEPAREPIAQRYEGTYDLTPLAMEGDNVSVAFLRRIGALTRASRIRAYAILTPTNHQLLHDYIDTSNYNRNLSFTRTLLAQYGVVVLNFDRVIPSAEFLDNDHLTIAGNRRLAALLRPIVVAR